MSTITTIQSTDLISASRTDINTNFSNLNTDKVEKIGDTMSGQLNFSGTTHAGIKLLSLTTTQRDALTASNGMIIYNTTTNELQARVATAWIAIGSDVAGTIKLWSTSSAPNGWLLCDASAVSRATYATLFGVIGTTYGVGNGTTTFNVPDLRNRFAMGEGTATKVATFASRSGNEITVTGLTNATNNEFQTGQAIVYHTTVNVITGLSNDTTYYIVRSTNLSFSLASSLANAQDGVLITLSGDGSGTQTFTLTLTPRVLGGTGGEEKHAMVLSELVTHTHAMPTHNGFSGSAVYNPSLQSGGNSVPNTGNGGSSGGAMNVLNPFLVLNYIIKT